LARGAPERSAQKESLEKKQAAGES